MRKVRREKRTFMNKKTIVAIGLIAFMALTTILTYKSMENLSNLDLSDPFEVDLEDN